MTLRETVRAFADAGIDDPKTDAVLLFCRFGGFSRAQLLTEDPDLSAKDFLHAVERRIKREPLQYIIGEVPFYNETYRVTRDCLIPRQDTELLVETALAVLPEKAHFADLCTGSGCVAVSCLANRTGLTCDAYDIEQATLDLARENAERNGVSGRVTFYRRDLLRDPLVGEYHAILSNPPYIASSVVDTLAPELAYEPRIALDAGEDALLFYRAHLSLARTALLPGGCMIFEIGYDQEEGISELARTAGMSCEIHRDLGGNPRVAVLKEM